MFFLRSSFQFLVPSSQTLHRGAGQGFEFMAGEVFLPELNVIDATARSFRDRCNQSRATSVLAAGELSAIGDVVKEQVSRRLPSPPILDD